MSRLIVIDAEELASAAESAQKLKSDVEDTRAQLESLYGQLLKVTSTMTATTYVSSSSVASLVSKKKLNAQAERMEGIVSVMNEAAGLTDTATKNVENNLDLFSLMVEAFQTVAVASGAVAVADGFGRLVEDVKASVYEIGKDIYRITQGPNVTTTGSGFKPRTEPPTSDNPYYGSKATTANCTTYAANRAREILGDDTISFSGNAKEWWKYKDDFAGYSTDVNEPKIGALMIWGDENCSGPGHVAVVEDIIYNADGSVKTVIYSESAWGGLWYAGGSEQLYGQYNWYGNATSSWGCTGQTPSQIEKVTQPVGGEKVTMGFVGYIYLE